jgi:hypothetical protein
MSHKSSRFTLALLPHAPGLHLRDVTLTADELALEVVTTQSAMPCPICAQLSAHVHSTYRRSLADLPWAGRRVRLSLAVRTFFCTTAACLRRIFTERLPSIVAPYARKTVRLTDVLRVVGFALGGEAGALSWLLRTSAPCGMNARSIRATAFKDIFVYPRCRRHLFDVNIVVVGEILRIRRSQWKNSVADAESWS